MSAQNTQAAVGVAGAAVTGLLPFLTTAAWAVPVVGTAVAAVSLAVTLLVSRKGPQQKVTTSQWANDAEAVLQQNLSAFLREPSAAAQAQALSNFDQVWAELSSRCGNPAMGSPGQACINDRRRGGKFDWFAAYRTPIEQAELARADAGLFAGGSSSPGGVPWWAWAAGGLGAIFIVKGAA